MTIDICDLMFPRMREIIPEGVSGNYSIQHFTINEKQATIYEIRGIFNRSYLGRFIKAGNFCRLKCKDRILMSDSYGERHSNREIVQVAHGEVLIAGLGIGMIICPIVKKDNVKHVTVIEISEDVIKLVEPHIRKYLGEDSSKLTIIHADIFDYVPTHKFDVIYFDIWGNYSGDEYPETKTLHRKFSRYLNKDGNHFMDSWMRWDIKRLYFEGRR